MTLLWCVLTVTPQLIFKAPETAAERRYRLNLGWIGSDRRSILRAAAALRLRTRTNDLRATLLARAFFAHTGEMCGGIASAPLDRGTFWLFHTVMGYEPEPWWDIRVDKRTGAVGWFGGKPVTDPTIFSPGRRLPPSHR